MGMLVIICCVGGGTVWNTCTPVKEIGGCWYVQTVYEFIKMVDYLEGAATAG